MPSAPAAHRSLWLTESLGGEPASPRLEASIRADVCIVGGGYVGLWTALCITELEPGCDVVVLEKDVCGGGASGRNGGFVLTWWPKIETLVSLCGDAEALRMARESERAVGEIDAFCRTHGIDAHFVRGGWLWSATNSAQIGSWNAVLRTCARLGAEPFRRLDPREVAKRSGSPVHLAGVVEGACATVQPAALARGLRRVALERGVRIYEGTRAQTFSRSQPAEIRTESGRVRADALVIANGAWAASIRELARRVVVVSSDIVATEPIPGLLAEIGWGDGISITDSQLRVHYYRTTRDGRIAFGKGGGQLAFGGTIGDSFDRSEERAAGAAADFYRFYPMLRRARITHDWSGPVDRTPNAFPTIGHLPGHPNIVHGVGWSGHGVGPSWLGGRILASLALRRRDEWSGSGVVGRSMGRFPPEPIRYVGGRIVRAAVVRKEAAEEAGRTPGRLDTVLAGLAPHG